MRSNFYNHFFKSPWYTALLFDDIDDVIYAWEQIFNSVLDSLCPWHEKRVKQATQPQWLTKAVLKLLHIRDRLLKVARRSDHMADWANYRSSMNKAVAILRSAKREFYNNSFENNKNNARAIWKLIKTLTGPKRNTPEISRLNFDGHDVDDPKEMANHFNSYFSTIADKLLDTISHSPCPNWLILSNPVRT